MINIKMKFNQQLRNIILEERATLLSLLKTIKVEIKIHFNKLVDARIEPILRKLRT